MPIYEYRCDNCAHEFETIQKVSDQPLKTCPACSEEALRKKVSAAGFRLKGGGWYETDFKGNKRKNVAGEEKTGKDADKQAGTAADGGTGSEKPAARSGGSSEGSSTSGDGSSSGASKSKASE